MNVLRVCVGLFLSFLMSCSVLAEMHEKVEELCSVSKPLSFTIRENATSELEGSKNEMLQISVCSQKSGYVSIWYLNSAQTITPLILGSVDAGRVMYVEAGKIYDFEHIVTNSSGGHERFKAIWTLTEEQEGLPKVTDLPMSQLSLKKAFRQPNLSWVTAESSILSEQQFFELPDNAKIGKPLKFKGYSGRVFLLAMGSKGEELRYPDRDASRFAGAMMSAFNIPKGNARTQPKATIKSFKSGIRWLTREVKPKDTVIIYFSGHGTEVPSTREGRGRREAFVFNDDNLLDKDFKKALDGIKTSNLLVFIDACFSAGLTKSVRSQFGGTVKYRDSGYRPDVMSKELVYAAKEGFHAWESRKYGGVMTTAILNELQKSANSGKTFQQVIGQALGNGKLQQSGAGIKPIGGKRDLLQRLRLY